MLRQTDEKYKKLPQFSASKIKTWKLCKKKYFYTYIEKPAEEHTEERNVGALLGTVLHRVIQEYYEKRAEGIIINPSSFYQEKMLTILEEWQQAGYKIIGEQWFSKSMKDGRIMLELFNWNRFNPVNLEERIDLPFPDKENPFARLTGYVDLIHKNADGSYDIVDHKSQKTMPSVEEMSNDAQFILYRWAFHAATGAYPNHVYWNDLRTSELIDTCVEDDYDNKLAALIEDMRSMFSATEYPKIEQSVICKRMCSFSDLCWKVEGSNDGSTR